MYVCVCVHIRTHNMGMMGSKERVEKSLCSLEMTSCSSVPLSGFPQGLFSSFCLSLPRNPSPPLTRCVPKEICTRCECIINGKSLTSSLFLSSVILICVIVTRGIWHTHKFLIRYYNVWWFLALKDLHTRILSYARTRTHTHTHHPLNWGESGPAGRGAGTCVRMSGRVECRALRDEPFDTWEDPEKTSCLRVNYRSPFRS